MSGTYSCAECPGQNVQRANLKCLMFNVPWKTNEFICENCLFTKIDYPQGFTVANINDLSVVSCNYTSLTSNYSVRLQQLSDEDYTYIADVNNNNIFKISSGYNMKITCSSM